MAKFLVKSVIIGIPEVIPPICDYEISDEIDAEDVVGAMENAYTLMTGRLGAPRSATLGDIFYVCPANAPNDIKIFRITSDGHNEITNDQATEWRKKSYAHRIITCFKG